MTVDVGKQNQLIQKKEKSKKRNNNKHEKFITSTKNGILKQVDAHVQCKE